jgi:pyrroloquinoline quinone biosynthesis protein D
MSGATTEDTRLAIGKGFRLQWEPAQSAHVLLYPEGMVKLNASAGEILRRCDGARTLGQVIADLESAFNQPGLASDVHDFVAFARAQGWLEAAV